MLVGADGLAYWQEFWIEKTVADITLKEQKRFRSWLAAKNIDAGGIDRILSDGRAALNRAVKWEELTRAPPHTFSNSNRQRTNALASPWPTYRALGDRTSVRCGEVATHSDVSDDRCEHAGASGYGARSSGWPIRRTA